MFSRIARFGGCAAAALGLMTLASCGQPSPPEQYGPPPPQAGAAMAQPVELAGGPPPPPGYEGAPPMQSGPAPMGPPPMQAAPPPAVVAMAPIPNPEDMSPAERARVYGGRQAPAARVRATLPAPSRPQAAAPTQMAGPPPTQVVAMAPIPNPRGVPRTERPRVALADGSAAGDTRRVTPVQPPRRERPRSTAPAYRPPPMVRAEPVRPARPAPVAKAAPAPVARPPFAAGAPVVARPPVVARAAPAAPKPAAKAPAPVAKALPAPVPAKPIPMPAPRTAEARAKPMPVAPVAPVAKAPTAAEGKLGQLQAALGGETARGATLSVGPEIGQGKPGNVSLSLPQTLMDSLKAQAAKLGLARAARKAEVSATLSGEGYSVTPNGRQTAPLKSGEAARFDWQVTPSKAAKGPLRADVDATLKGAKTPQTLSLATIQSAVASTAAEAQKKAGGFHLPKLKFPSFGKPAEGEVAGPPPAPGADADAAATGDTGLSLMSTRTLPVIGPVSGRTQLAALLAIAALVVLGLVSRNMARQRRLAERRRRYRTYQPLGDEAPAGEPVRQKEPEPA